MEMQTLSSDLQVITGVPSSRNDRQHGLLLGHAAKLCWPCTQLCQTSGKLREELSALQVVTGESGSSEDRQREQLLRRVTELRGAITRAQDRYGAVLDALGPPGDTSAVPPPVQQVSSPPRIKPGIDLCAGCLGQPTSSSYTQD